MTRRRYDTLRLQLIRLYQVMERHKDLEAEMLRGSRGPGATTPFTLSVLATMEGSRRHVRVRDRLPVVYSESPDVAEELVAGGSRTTQTMEFASWLRELSGQKQQWPTLSAQMELRIHLQRFEEELVYFLTFRRPSPNRKRETPRRDIVISGSGLSFPTEVHHPQGEDLLVVYFLPTNPFPPLQLIGKVVRPSTRCPGGGFQTPVRFVEISDRDRQRILGYIASRQRQKQLVKAYDLDS